MSIKWYQDQDEKSEQLEFLQWFIESCWECCPAAEAAGLLQRQFKKLHTETVLSGVAA